MKINLLYLLAVVFLFWLFAPSEGYRIKRATAEADTSGSVSSGSNANASSNSTSSVDNGAPIIHVDTEINAANNGDEITMENSNTASGSSNSGINTEAGANSNAAVEGGDEAILDSKSTIRVDGQDEFSETEMNASSAGAGKSKILSLLEALFKKANSDFASAAELSLSSNGGIMATAKMSAKAESTADSAKVTADAEAAGVDLTDADSQTDLFLTTNDDGTSRAVIANSSASGSNIIGAPSASSYVSAGSKASGTSDTTGPDNAMSASQLEINNTAGGRSTGKGKSDALIDQNGISLSMEGDVKTDDGGRMTVIGMTEGNINDELVDGNGALEAKINGTNSEINLVNGGIVTDQNEGTVLGSSAMQNGTGDDSGSANSTVLVDYLPDGTARAAANQEGIAKGLGPGGQGGSSVSQDAMLAIDKSGSSNTVQSMVKAKGEGDSSSSSGMSEGFATNADGGAAGLGMANSEGAEGAKSNTESKTLVATGTTDRVLNSYGNATATGGDTITTSMSNTEQLVPGQVTQISTHSTSVKSDGSEITFGSSARSNESRRRKRSAAKPISHQRKSDAIWMFLKSQSVRIDEESLFLKHHGK